MTMQVADIRWTASLDALRDAVGRVTALLRSDVDPSRPAVGEWSLVEVAMHLSQAWVVVPGLGRGDLSRVYEVMPSMEGIAGDNFIRDIWDLGGVTKLGVSSDPERDPRVLADRIEERAAEFFAEQAGRAADELCPWLVGGTMVPRSVLTGHLLNETLMHGRDIARAAGRPWPVNRDHAAMVFTGFILEVMRVLPPRAFVDPAKGKGVKASFYIHLRGNDEFIFDFDDGELHVEAASRRKVDCHLSADPLAFLLVAWNRRSQWSAIARGELLAWGRKPWVGLRLRSLIRNP